MDFIEKLPSSSEFDTILVIVNQLTKQAIFISTHNTIIFADLSQIRYSLVVILELNSVSEVQYKDIMIDR